MTKDDPAASHGGGIADSRLPFAWQPFTPRGVASFAHATLRRLVLVQLLTAMLTAGVVAWFLSAAWFPTVRHAIRHLPEEGVIRGQALELPTGFAQILAENRPFLLIVLDLDKERNASQTSDLLIEFHKRNVQLCSLLGCLRVDYPKTWNVEFNRPKLAPLWEAWEPIALALSALLSVLLLFASWTVLATLYCAMVRMLGFFKDRDLNWGSSWRLASASLMPGAVVLTIGILCYGLDAIDLIRLLVLFLIHFVIGWIYLAISPWFVPRLPGVLPPGTNPFAGKDSPS